MSNYFTTTTETFRWKIRKHKKQVVNFCQHMTMCGVIGLGLVVAGSGGALANPEGGNVVAGSATITNTATELQINQSSNKALIEWSSFNIDAGETTRFIQPSTSAIAINRVVNSSQISSINGNLIANGKVVIINPNGVLIGANGNIDTNSFLATSADIDNDAFMNGTGAFDFNRSGNIDAVVENRGSISVAAEGLAALVAPTARNSGVVQGSLAKVQLAAADTFVVDFYGDGLISYAVEGGSQERTITAENDGEIFADGGAVLMTAADASAVVDSVINNEGIIEAASLERRGGKIVLTGGGATVKVSGKLDVSGQGDSDGGEILVGGDYQGGGDVATAENVEVTETAELYADAGDNGDGGKVIVWSEGKTTSRGKYTARGGAQSGNGGFVETSSKYLLDIGGTQVNTLAPNGDAGYWLLDPDNINITTSGLAWNAALPANGTSDIDVASINSALSNVVLAANLGITFATDVNMTNAGAGLTVIAGIQGTGIDIPDTGAFTELEVGQGTISFTNQFIRTNGGDVNFYSGNSITQNNATIFTDGGDITMVSGSIGINNNAALGAYGGDVLLRAIAAGTGSSKTSGNVSTNSSSIDTTDPGAGSIGGITLTENGAALPQGSYGNPQNVFVETDNGGTITIEGKTIGGNSICFAAGGPGCSVLDPVASDIVVTIDSFTKIYGVLDPLFTWGITSGSLTGGDVLSVDLARTLQNTLAGEQVGNYSIFQTSNVITGSGLYNITFINGNLEIIPASVVITAIDQNKIYGDTTVFDETNPGDYNIAGLVTNVNGFATGDTITNVSLASTGSGATADVGAYSIDASNAAGTNLSNYDITYTSGTLDVLKRALNLDVNDKSMTYGGAAPTLTASYSGFVNGDTIADIDTLASLSSLTAFTSDAGTYVDTLQGSGAADNNYTFNYNFGDLTINKADLTVTALGDAKIYDSLVYAGGNGVTYSGFVNGDTDADLGGILAYGGTSQGAIDVGAYGIAASGYTSNNYNISYNAGTLNITPAALSITADNQVKTYGDSFAFVGNEFSTSGLVGSETLTSATLSSLGAVNTATVAGSTYDIDISNASGTANLSNYSVTYNKGQMTVDPKALTITASNDAKIYDAASYAGGNGVTYSGFVNSETDAVLGGTLAYGGTSQGATNVGAYDIEASGLTSTNYDISYVDGTLNITPAALSITADNQVKTYGDSFAFVGNEFSTSGLVGSETLTSATLSSLGAVNTATVAGSTYDIDISNAGGGTADLNNYSVTYNKGQMTVDPKALTITADNQVKTYGDSFVFVGNEFSTSGLVGSETLTSATFSSLGSVNTATVAGSTYDIDISNAGGGTADLNNYSVTYNKGQMTVDPKALMITANNDAKIYDAVAYFGGNGVTYSGFVNGENENTSDLAGTISYGGNSQGAVNVGNYVITPSGQNSSNYAITYNDGQLDITAAALLLVAANNQTKTYGDSFTFNGTEFTPTGLFGTDSVTSATITSGGAVNTANAGSYSIDISNAVGSGLANYSISYQPGTFTVNKALLTATADDKSMTYGGLAPALTTTYTGFVNGENTGVIDTLASVTSGTSFTSDAGVYTDTLAASGAADNNYDFTYVAGDLTINKAALLGLTGADSKTYDGQAYSGGNGVIYLGFVNGDNAGDLSGTLSYSGTSQGATNVGVYSLNGGGQTSNNYNITYAGSSLNITPARLLIEANDQTKTYGDTFTFNGDEFTASGLVNGETLTSASLSSLGSVNTATVAGSDYDIDISAATGGTANLSNYNVSYAKGAMKVNQADLTITLDDQTKTEGQSFVFDGTEYSVTGLKLSDQILSVFGQSDGAPAIASAGSYPINWVSVTSSFLLFGNNYNTAIIPGTFTVSSVPVVLDPVIPSVEIDPLGRPIISVANQAIVLDEPFEEIETLEILTDVGIADSGTSADALAGIEPAAGGEPTAEEVASIEPAAGGGENEDAQEDDEFSNDIRCANDFLDNKECDIQDI